jgi:hypothetical protein
VTPSTSLAMTPRGSSSPHRGRSTKEMSEGALVPSPIPYSEPSLVTVGENEM